MRVKDTACDSGGESGVTTNAYNFWRWLKTEHPAGHHRRFHLVKGEAKRSAPRIRLGYPDSQRKDRHSGARGDVPVLFINTNLVKDLVDGKLKRLDPGGGRVNFPTWAPDWLYAAHRRDARDAALGEQGQPAQRGVGPARRRR
jgi:phage terminase large subunit GpA-like protein